MTPPSRRASDLVRRILRFCGTAAVAAAVSQLPAADVPREDPGRVAIRIALEAERDRLGAAPPADAFGPALRAAGFGPPGKPISSELLRAAWLDFRTMQNPPVSPERLAELASQRRDALRQVKITYRTVRTGHGLTPKWPDRVATACRFVRSGPRLFFEERKGPSPESLEDCDFVAHDGTVVRKRWGTADDRANAEIHPLENTDPFFDGDNPLLLSLALDADLLRGSSTRPEEVDLTRQFGDGKEIFVQERPVTIDGRECLLVTAPLGGPSYHLAPSLGGAIVRAENAYFDSRRNDSGGIEMFVAGGTRTAFSDFRERGGVWIPFRIERTTTFNGRVDASIITVDECEIGGPIPDSTFTHVFPPWWTVEDHVRGGHVGTWPFGIEAGFRAIED